MKFLKLPESWKKAKMENNKEKRHELALRILEARKLKSKAENDCTESQEQLLKLFEGRKFDRERYDDNVKACVIQQHQPRVNWDLVRERLGISKERWQEEVAACTYKEPTSKYVWVG